jgi:molybdate transport system regulatory protein
MAGKIGVLEEIARAGSISATGRTFDMSSRRTRELVEELHRSLGKQVVGAAAGGGGGGAVLTRLVRLSSSVIVLFSWTWRW